MKTFIVAMAVIAAFVAGSAKPADEIEHPKSGTEKPKLRRGSSRI